MDRKNPKILAGVANCISFLAMLEDGKEIAYYNDILVKLNKLLHDEVYKMEFSF